MMEGLRDDKNCNKHILFYPEGSDKPIELAYAKGVDSFRLCIDGELERCVGFHLSLLDGTFEWKKVEE